MIAWRQQIADQSSQMIAYEGIPFIFDLCLDTAGVDQTHHNSPDCGWNIQQSAKHFVLLLILGDTRSY
eukprot:9445260-Pyramimonas_sp.AAC.2